MSFSDVAPVKPAKDLLKVTRTSCLAAREASGIGLSLDRVDTLLDRMPSTLPTDPKWLESGYKLPLNYPSRHAEFNVICHLCFLNSLSGYRAAFHRFTGQGAHKNIVKLVLSMYLEDPAGDSGLPLSAATLASLTPLTVLGLWGVPTHIEEAHPELPGTVVGQRRRDAIYEAANVLCIAANDTGKRLQEMRCPDLGTFVERTLTTAKVDSQGDDEAFAALAASALTTALPAFNDAYTIPSSSTTVYLHKRAYLILSWLRARFGKDAGAPPLPSASVLPAFIDNVIPSLLVYWGILDVSTAKDESLRAWNAEIVQSNDDANDWGKDERGVVPGPKLSREQAYIIRAAAQDACQHITLRGHELAKQDESKRWMAGLNDALVDGYIWTSAKDKDLCDVPRMVETETFMY